MSSGEIAPLPNGRGVFAFNEAESNSFIKFAAL
jgi:hypothetical protein